MILNSFFKDPDSIMLCIALCCVLILSAIMIPKAIRYRKQVKQNESEKPAPDEGQEVEITIISGEDMKSNQKQTFDYHKTFLIAPKLVDRKPVFLSKTTRDNLDKIARRLGDRKMSVSGFLENMAKHHLEEYREVIEKLYKE